MMQQKKEMKMQVMELKNKSPSEPISERSLKCVSSFDKIAEKTCINNLPISLH